MIMTMDEATLKKVLAEVFDEKFAQFYIPPERHYREHLWLQDLMSWSDKIKSSALRTIVSSIVGGILVLIVIGFIVFSGSGKGGG